MAKQEPKEAATPTEKDSGMEISFSEMQAGYEAQIGAMSSQLIQQGIIIEKLRTELTAKREPT